MYDYDTLVAALNDLKKRGYVEDFNIAFDKLQCASNGVCLLPSEFKITETYRFEGESNPDDSSALFAVESNDGKLKGTFVMTYGTYADENVDPKLLSKLRVDYKLKK